MEFYWLVSVRIDCAVRKNDPAPFAGPEHSDDFVAQEIRRPIRVPEFTGFLKDTPSNREGLLYQFSVGHSRENGPSTDMFLYSTPGEPDEWRW